MWTPSGAGLQREADGGGLARATRTKGPSWLGATRDTHNGCCAIIATPSPRSQRGQRSICSSERRARASSVVRGSGSVVEKVTMPTALASAPPSPRSRRSGTGTPCGLRVGPSARSWLGWPRGSGYATPQM